MTANYSFSSDIYFLFIPDSFHVTAQIFKPMVIPASVVQLYTIMFISWVVKVTQNFSFYCELLLSKKALCLDFFFF